jgi:hypothetical protein
MATAFSASAVTAQIFDDVVISKENYFLRRRRLPDAAPKGQQPPDLRYFRAVAKRKQN